MGVVHSSVLACQGFSSVTGLPRRRLQAKFAMKTIWAPKRANAPTVTKRFHGAMGFKKS